MSTMTRDKFEEKVSGPAVARLLELEKELADADRVIERLISAPGYDEPAALKAAERLEEVRRAHALAQRRLDRIYMRRNTSSGGEVYWP